MQILNVIYLIFSKDEKKMFNNTNAYFENFQTLKTNFINIKTHFQKKNSNTFFKYKIISSIKIKNCIL